MEYGAPLPTADAILQMIKAAEGGVMEIQDIHRRLRSEEHTPTIVNNAIVRLKADEKIVSPSDNRFSLGHDALQFIADGGYKGMCERANERLSKLSQREQLEERQIESAINANNSTNTLNTVILPDNFAFQKFIGRRTLWIGSISAVFILVTIVQNILSKTEEKLESISQQLQQTTKSLDSIHTSLEKINSSMKSDTAKHQ